MYVIAEDYSTGIVNIEWQSESPEIAIVTDGKIVANGVGNASIEAIVTFCDDVEYTYSFSFDIIPKATKVSKLTAKSKAFTVKWKKQTKAATGYEIQYSTDKAFSTSWTKTISSSKKSSAKITDLKANTNYYVRIRTYKTVGGKKFYSSWSKVKKVKTQ